MASTDLWQAVGDGVCVFDDKKGVGMDEVTHGGERVPAEDVERAEARKRIEKRRNLLATLVAYVVVNAGFVSVWAVTGRGYFWPGWVIALWGVGMVLGLFDYLRRPITESDVDAELVAGHAI
jgi:hypothetical protein